MKALRLLILIVVLLSGFYKLHAASESIPERLASISVTVDTPSSIGSGVAFTRKDATGKDITFIWTVGHVICYHIEPDSILTLVVPSNTNGFYLYYTNLIVYQNISVNGQFVYQTNAPVKIIKSSPNEIGQDLAVLQVEGKFFNKNSVVFDLSGNIPKLGEPLYGVSSPYGEDRSFSTGVCSGVGRNIDDLIFDQSTLIVHPGSSGGGVYSTDGKCIGLSVVMKADGVNYFVPIRRMQQWAKKEGIEWALDPSIPMPSEMELTTMTINDKTPRLVDRNKVRQIKY